MKWERVEKEMEIGVRGVRWELEIKKRMRDERRESERVTNG